MNLPSIAKILGAGALLTAHLHAAAIPSSPREYHDEDTGKHWLQLSETVGMSIQDFLDGADGWNDSYRLAKTDEVDQLIKRYGIFTTPGGLHPSFGGFFMDIGGYQGTWQQQGTRGAIGYSYDTYVSVTLIDGDSNPGLGDCPALSNCISATVRHDTQPLNDRNPEAGLFLVRLPDTEIPEPATLALFGVAALAALRKRRGAA